jgi:hypothetical protein
MKYRESDNLLETIIGQHVVDIARGECMIRQRSMLLSIADDRDHPVDCRQRLEAAAANYIAETLGLARAHGTDPLRDLGLVDLELVRLAVAPLNRKEAVS